MYVQCLCTCMGLFEHVEGKPQKFDGKEQFSFLQWPQLSGLQHFQIHPHV